MASDCRFVQRSNHAFWICPLPRLYPTAKRDVVAFMDYLENPGPHPMAASMKWLDTWPPDWWSRARRLLKKQARRGTSSGTFTWKNNYRRNLIDFWLGNNNPEGSLNEIICAHAQDWSATFAINRQAVGAFCSSSFESFLPMRHWFARQD